MRAQFGTDVAVLSGGIEPAEAVNRVGAAVLSARGIDITDQTPRRVTEDDLRTATVVITLVPGLVLTRYDGVRHEQWTLPDPAEWNADQILPVVDELAQRVAELATRI